MNPPGGNISQTVPWEELDKPKFYAYGITFFTGVRALLHPTFVIKTKIQVSRGEGEKGMLGMARSIVRKDGVRGLYKGFWVSSSSLIFRQFYFTTYEIIRHRLGPGSKVYQRLGPDAGEVVRNLSAGAGSSVVFQVFTVPIDIISQRMMVGVAAEGAVPVAAAEAGGGAGAAAAATAAVVQNGGAGARGMETSAKKNSLSMFQVARQVYGESGILGFYRGFYISILQFAPTSAIWWAAYGLYSSTFLRALRRLPPGMASLLTEEQRQNGTRAAAGLCTGMTTVVLTNPLDVLRTRLQVEGRRGDDRTLRSEYQALVRESGLRGLMRGIGPRLAAAAPASSLIVTVYELIKRLSRKPSPEVAS